MRELERRRRVKRILYSVPSLVLLLVVTFLFAKGAFRILDKERESRGKVRILEERTAALALRQQELNKSISRLQTEEGIKDEIKERFSVSSEGEYVAVIVDDRNKASTTEVTPISWYKRLWAVIMGDNE